MPRFVGRRRESRTWQDGVPMACYGMRRGCMALKGRDNWTADRGRPGRGAVEDDFKSQYCSGSLDMACAVPVNGRSAYYVQRPFGWRWCSAPIPLPRAACRCNCQGCLGTLLLIRPDTWCTVGTVCSDCPRPTVGAAGRRAGWYSAWLSLGEKNAPQNWPVTIWPAPAGPSSGRQTPRPARHPPSPPTQHCSSH